MEFMTVKNSKLCTHIRRLVLILSSIMSKNTRHCSYPSTELKMKLAVQAPTSIKMEL